jgi:WD40 repeat protein
MKLTLFSILGMLFVSTVSLPITFAQEYNQWHLPEGVKARLGKGAITGNVQYSPDGTLLAVSSSIGVWLYDVDTHEEVNLLTGHTAWVSCVAFSPDGQTLASGSWDRTIRLWNPHTGQHKATLMRDNMGDVTSIAFSPDGSTLASGGGRWNKTIQLWDTETGNHIGTLRGIREMSLPSYLVLTGKCLSAAVAGKTTHFDYGM